MVLWKYNAIFILGEFMGICASYYAISTEMMNLYHSNNDETMREFYGNLEKLQETNYYYDLIKSWDILHYICSGFTSTYYHQPIESSGFLDKLKSIFQKSYNHKEIFATEKQKYLYYAFYGKNIPVTDDTSFNDYDDIVKIISYLNEIDIRIIIETMDYHKIPFDELYPKLSVDDFKDNEMIDIWVEHFENLKQFYQNALKEKRCVCVMIG